MTWESNGIRGLGDRPPVAGNFKGQVVVMGSARCLWDDLSQVQGDPEYMAVNLSGCFAARPLSHWVSLHPEEFPAMLTLYRANGGFPMHVHTHAPKKDPADFAWEFDYPQQHAGTSALFAVLVALALGYDQVVVAGVPLNGTGCFYAPFGFAQTDYQSNRMPWLEIADVFQGRVKSFSGFTRALLGAPYGL